MRTANLVIGGLGASHRLFPTLFAAAIGVLGSQITSRADPITDLRSLSVFKGADLGKMAGGEVLASKGPAMSLARGLSVESAYIVRAPVKTTLALQQRWDPTRHPELKIYVQGDVGRGNDFQGLASVRSNSSVKAFVDATLRLPGDASKLQLSRAEASMFSPGGSSEGAMPASVVAFWSKVLAERARSFNSGGLGAEAAYETAGSPVRVGEEVSRLIGESGNVRTYFSSLISSTPIGGGRGSAPTSQTWQMFDADGIAAVSLTASYGKPGGDGYQAADLQYYASGAVYTVLTFYQLWPVKVDNQDATLIWRVDMTSASQLGELRGVERMGSGAAMMREIQKSVKAFLRDNSRG
ncbi:MAG TPA: hypothetical protein VGF37_08495 [Chthoniobacterales bacterium]